jgi:hypothetical protein
MNARRPPTIAEQQFAKHTPELLKLDLQARFARIYETNLWADRDSRSGIGSNLEAPPFSFTAALDTIVEHCREGDGAYGDKSLLVWPLDRLPQVSS